MIFQERLWQHSACVTAVAVRIELVSIDLAAERVAVNAKNFGGARLISIGPVQHALDETFFELADGFVEKNPPFHHLYDEPFQLIFHDGTLR